MDANKNNGSEKIWYVIHLTKCIHINIINQSVSVIRLQLQYTEMPFDKQSHIAQHSTIAL